MCGDTNTTAAQQDANRAGRIKHNKVHITNSREWTDKEKRQIVCINLEKRQKIKNFMKRIKDYWNSEFPDKRRTTQNLVDSAIRFAKERWGKRNS